MLAANKITGLSLFELMVSLVIAAVALVGIIGVFSSNIRSTQHNVAVTKLDNELRMSLSLIQSDMRRIGYWNQAADMLGTGSNTNPFSSASTDLFISADGSCVTYSYDLNKDGQLAAIDDATQNERFGFRLMNQTLQMRPATGDVNCDSPASSWNNVTDPSQVQITSLVFSESLKTIELTSVSKSIIINEGMVWTEPLQWLVVMGNAGLDTAWSNKIEQLNDQSPFTDFNLPFNNPFILPEEDSVLVDILDIMIEVKKKKHDGDDDDGDDDDGDDDDGDDDDGDDDDGDDDDGDDDDGDDDDGDDDDGDDGDENEPTIAIRTINVSLTGRLTRDQNISRTLTSEVKVRNDKFNSED